MAYKQCEFCRKPFPRNRMPYHLKECRVRRMRKKQELARQGLNVIERIDDGSLIKVEVVKPEDIILVPGFEQVKLVDNSWKKIEEPEKKKRGRPKGSKK